MGYNNANYNCADDDCAVLPQYDETIESCGAKGRLAGSSLVYGLLCGNYITNPGSLAEWDALVLAGKAVRYSNVKFGMGQPTPIEVDSTTSCGTKEVVNYLRSAQMEDYKVGPNNSYFWSQSRKRKLEALMFVECPTPGLIELVSLIDAEITIASYRDYPNTNEQLQKYVVDFGWKDPDDPIQYNATAA